MRHSAITSKALAHGVGDDRRCDGAPPRGEYAKSAARRQEIVAAALEVFSEAGYHKGSIRDVADRVGLSQAGLLHHYPSKHLLLEAVLDWRDQDALARMGAEQPQGLAMLEALVDLAQHNATTPQVVELHVTLSAEATSEDHPVHDYFVRRYAWLLGMVADAFEHAAARRPAQTGCGLPQRRDHPGRADGRAAGAVAAGPGLRGHGRGAAPLPAPVAHRGPRRAGLDDRWSRRDEVPSRDSATGPPTGHRVS